MTKIYSFTCQNSNLPAVFQCDNWTSQQVAEWLNGVDDGMAPYIRHFITHNITGNKLLNVDNATLKRIGVNREASRAKIISAINLLLYYSYSIKYENLQKLALKTRVCTNEILEAVSIATPIINNSSNASMHIEVLNNVLGALASTYENTIRLIFWLERNPFVGNKKYAKMRNNLATYIDEMVDCVNNPNNPKFFSVPQLLIERAKLIQQVCNEIIHLPDPSILYTAFLDRVTIRRPATADWGFEIGRTCLGINLITRVDYNSPSAFPDKFDVGDEILEINGQSVIGWKRTSLLRRLNEKQPFLRPGQAQFSNLENVETQLLLCKRPRESCSPHRFPKVQDCGNMGGDQEAKRLTKLALDFKNKIGTDFSMRWHRNQKECSKDMKRLETNNSNHLALRRVRSSSFTANVNSNSRRCSDCSLPQASRCISLLIPMGKQQLFRRASVWNESPPGTLHSPFKDSNSWLLLLASWGTDNRLTTATKPDRIQKRPPPLKGILEPGGVSVVVDKGETEDGQNGIVFSSVEIVPENELLKIGTSLAVIVEPEWSAPIKEITGISTQQRDPFSENTVNSLPVVSESPLSNIHAKIARFFYGEVSTPSPSPSGIIQQNSQPTTTSDPIIHIKTFLPKTNSECKTPITPNSKYSLELPFSSSTSTKLGEGSSSSLCSVDSPSYTSTIVKTASSSRNRLAPLAEPDEVGDLLLTYVPISASENALNKCLNSTNIPQNLQKSPIIEGLILRELFQSEYKRQIFRASFRRKRWTKCWGLIREGFFQIHSNQSSTEADFLIDLSLSTITTKPEIQTSKKHIFLLKNKNKGLKIHFALYSNEELNKWLEAIIQQQQSNLIMTSSTSSNECPNILQKSSSRASNNIESVSPPILPCSHVGHVFRHASPHDFPKDKSSGKILNSNLARVSEVWMDQWRHFFYKIAPQASALIPTLDVSERIELRKKLNCRNFNWYLQNVWKDNFLPNGRSALIGRFRHLATNSCLFGRPSSPGRRHRLSMGTCSLGFDIWQFWVLSSSKESDGLRLMSDEHQCLSAAKEQTENTWRVQLRECGGHKMEFWRWEHRTRHFVHINSSLCLDEPIESVNSFPSANIFNFDGKEEKPERLPKMSKCMRGKYSQQWELNEIKWLPENDKKH